MVNIKIAIVFVMVVVLFLSPTTPVAHAWKKSDKFDSVALSVDIFQWLKKQPKYDKAKTNWYLVHYNDNLLPFNGKPGLVVSWDSSVLRPFSVKYRSADFEYYLDINSPSEYYQIDGNDVKFISTVSVGTLVYLNQNIKGFSLGKANWYCIDDKPCVDVADVDPSIRLPVVDPTVIKVTERCKWHDVVCWIGNGITAIGDSISEFFNGFVKVMQNLMEFFSHLFIPGDDNLFVKAFDNINDYMHKKLGFLTFPFDFVASVFKMFFNNFRLGSEVSCKPQLYMNYACHPICAPNVFGSAPLCLSISDLENRFPQLWQAIIVVVRFCVVIGLVELMRIKYYSIVRS